MIACLLLAASAIGCGPKPEPTSVTTLSSADARTGADLWAERKVAAELEAARRSPAPAVRESFDPLGSNELEESMIPKTDRTPPGRVRRKTPAELDAAVAAVRSASTVEAAVKALTLRLGNPSWIESPRNATRTKRRVWIADAGAQCRRLVLEPNGTVTVDSATKREWRLVTASARQNPCTGEIKRGLP